MPLEVQQLEISAGSGLQQDVDRRLLPADGRWLRAENVVMNARGAWTPRNGYQKPASTQTYDLPPQSLPAIDWLDTRGGELLAYGVYGQDNLPHVWTWSPYLPAWVRRCDVAPATFQTFPAATPQTGAWAPQLAVTSTGIRSTLFGAQDAPVLSGPTAMRLVFKLEDVATGALVQDETTLATGAGWVYCHFALGPVLATVVEDLASQILSLFIYDPATKISTLFPLGLPPVAQFDAAPVQGDSTRWALTYTDPATPGVLYVEHRDVAGVLLAGTTLPVVAQYLGITARSTVGTAVAYQTAGNVVFRALFPDPLGAATDNTAITAAGAVAPFSHLSVDIDDSANCVVLFEGTYLGVKACYARGLDSAGTLAGAIQRGVNALATSRVKIINGRAFATLILEADRGGNVWTSVLACVDRYTGLSPNAFQLCGVLNTTASPFGAVGSLGLPTQQWAELSKDQLELSLSTFPGPASAKAAAANVSRLAFDFRQRQDGLRSQPVEQRGCLYHPGAYAGSYDGAADVEVAFAAPPLVTAAGGGPGLIPPGAYLYTAIYEWQDDAGNIVQSAPAPIESYDTSGAGAPSQAALTIRTLGLSRMGDPATGVGKNISIAVFRTEAGGSVFYRLTPPPTIGTVALFNDKTAETVAYADNVGNVLALGYGTLYTDGGIQANLPVPGARAVCSWGNRLWLAACDDPRKVYFSKPIVKGEGPGFHEGFVVRLDDSAGGVTALAPLGTNLLIFTASAIYVVSGDGPNDTGQAGSFNGPRLLVADTGCVDGRSIAVYPGGCVFLSANGLRQVTGDGQISDIGDPVQDETKGATVLRSIVDAPRQRVYSILDYGTSQNQLAVFDYHFGCWSTWRTYGRVAGDPPVPQPGRVFAHCLWNGKHILSTAEQGIIFEAGAGEPGLDDLVYPVATLETPWVHVGGVAGFQRLRRVTIVGERLSYHACKLEFFVDFNDSTAVQSVTFDAGSASTIEGLPVERLQVHVARQKSAAVKVRISSLPPAAGAIVSSPVGFDLAAVQFEIGVKPPGSRLPTTNKG